MRYQRHHVQMEEFWKDITLSPSHSPPTTIAVVGGEVSHTAIQEFLALPPQMDGRATGTVSTSPHQDGPPATTWSVNTHLPLLSPDIDSPPVPLPPLHNSLNRKRGPESVGNSAGNRRHERLMKNRESAARSRARKQAYTYELEMKVAHLKRENAKLRRQKEKLSVEVPAMPSKKNKLHRTLTAPF